MEIDMVRVFRVVTIVLLICIIAAIFIPFLGIVDVFTSFFTLGPIYVVIIIVYYIFLTLYVKTSNTQSKKVNSQKNISPIQIFYMAIFPAIALLFLMGVTIIFIVYAVQG